MSDRWTPGPWRADGPDMFGDYNILHPADGLAVAAAVGSAYPEEPRPVVVIPTNLRSPEEVGANARLISAAPDMAEDIEKYRSDVATLLQIIAGLPVALDGSDAVVVAEIDARNSAPSAALAKARGQA